MIGERVGNWIVEAEIGQNEMGRLYRGHSADDSSLRAAMRWLTHAKGKDPEFERLFLAQIELLRKLRHPNIVAVLGGGAHAGSPFYAMEWVTGTDFQTLLRRGEKILWENTLAIALQIVPALRYAHRRSVLHRDLRPANLFRCDDGAVKLADFGVTKFFGDTLVANAENVLGPAAYLSPEQAAGKPHTKRSDFYALGCLLYTLVAGRPPFTASTVVEMTHKHCFVLPERPVHYVPDLPEEFDRLIMKLLAKEPAQRPGSGTLLIQELEGIWSLLERRGQVGKRPRTTTSLPDDDEVAVEDDALPPPLLPEPIPRAPLPWQRRWYVVGPLFAACLFVLLWAFFWRHPDAEELMSKARPLLDSNNPADWDKAWNEYIEPLSRRYPQMYKEEVAEARRRVDQQGELNRAFLAGKSVRNHGAAERFYREGLRLVEAGEFVAARRIFDNLIVVFAGIEEEDRWTNLAREAVARIDARERMNPSNSTTSRLEEATRPVLVEIKRLRQAGKSGEADALARALEFLYRDDPEIEMLRQLLSSVR